MVCLPLVAPWQHSLVLLAVQAANNQVYLFRLENLPVLLSGTGGLTLCAEALCGSKLIVSSGALSWYRSTNRGEMVFIPFVVLS